MAVNGGPDSGPKGAVTEDEYGVLKKPNIANVVFGDLEIQPWYGNAAYFDTKYSHHELGIEVANGVKQKKDTTRGSTTRKTPPPGFGSEIDPENLGIWLDRLFVCEYCFKYTIDEDKFEIHRVACKQNKSLPMVGKLVYRDDVSPYLIRQVRGYLEPLFCQNLCLFGKLFLDDKSVYYNVNQFDFYVLYGFDPNDMPQDSYKEPNFKPMGFFSKELLSWDGDNNLACICVFPPYQRMHLGSLLIEFLYEVAKLTPGQYFSGPEFPLSPFGKVSYYNFWSKKLGPLILQEFNQKPECSLSQIAHRTGFRKEDILLTLDFMKVLLERPDDDSLVLLLGNVEAWCHEHRVDANQETSMLKEDCILL